MTERSGPWDGTSIGDATEAAYDAPTEFARFLEALHGGTANRGGVVVDKLNELAITAPGSVSPVSINSGWAVVYGTWYERDATDTVVIPTPAVSTRIDRIVLRKDWSAQTVRVTRIAGTEGAGAPSLVQTVGTTWDVPLAQVSIVPGTGAITLTDQRVFIPVHGDRSGESTALHAASQISGLAASGDSTPVKSTYGVAGVIGADTNNYANDDHAHPLDEESRGVLVRADNDSLTNIAPQVTIASVPVLASGAYYINGWIIASTDTLGVDLLLRINGPAGSSGNMIFRGIDPASGTAELISSQGAPVSAGVTFDLITTASRIIEFSGFITIGVTAGNFIIEAVTSAFPGTVTVASQLMAVRQ
jgi:hypothetical protein